MELVLEILNGGPSMAEQSCRKTFRQAGGTIGRAPDCYWVIPDRKRHLSSHHALISYGDGAFFLTDTSSNGVQDSSGARLPKDKAVRVEHGSVYLLGGFRMGARLSAPDIDVALFQAVDSLIPDDAFLELDPLHVLEQQEHLYSEIDDVISADTAVVDTRQHADYARIDRESLIVPELVNAPAAPVPAQLPRPTEQQGEQFWDHFAVALGTDLKDLSHPAREALALNVARLLRQCVGGLQQSLRTRSELKGEWHLAPATVQDADRNPLEFAPGVSEALAMLLQPNPLDHLPAEQAISRACQDLQGHQVAMLSACRAAMHGTLEHFSPQRLTLRFERENKPLLATSGSRWRAYGRYHQRLCQDNAWIESLLARDFAQAYEEQVRLISTLRIDHQG